MFECMLTTTDNPYDPFDQLDEWISFDMQHHNCSAYLDRVARTSSQLTEQENATQIERAIDEIVTKYNFSGLYKKVKREVKDTQ